MNAIDAIILVVLVLSALIGLVRGLTREGLGLMGWVGATLLAPLSLPAVNFIARGYISNPMIADGITLTVNFIILLIAFTILSHILAGYVKDSKVGGLDRVLGLGFGIIRGSFMLGTLEIGLSIFIGREQYPAPLIESRLVPAVIHLSNGLRELIPQRILDMAHHYAPPTAAPTQTIPLPPASAFNPLQQPVPDPQLPASPQQQTTVLKDITKAAAAAAVDQTVTELAKLKPQSKKTTAEKQEGYNNAQRSEMDRLIQTTE
jgi:membrane protein required for colicin V production